MIISNVWDSVTNDPESSFYGVGSSSMPMTDYVLQHYLVYVLVVGFSTLIVAFSQRGGF